VVDIETSASQETEGPWVHTPPRGEGGAAEDSGVPRPPRVCLDSCKVWGREVAIFGRIVSYTRDTDIGRTWEDLYRHVGLFVHLEEKIYRVVEARSLEAEAEPDGIVFLMF